MYFINFPDDGFRPKFVFDICGYTVHDKIYSNSVHCLPKKQLRFFPHEIEIWFN